MLGWTVSCIASKFRVASQYGHVYCNLLLVCGVKATIGASTEICEGSRLPSTRCKKNERYYVYDEEIN